MRSEIGISRFAVDKAPVQIRCGIASEGIEKQFRKVLFFHIQAELGRPCDPDRTGLLLISIGILDNLDLPGWRRPRRWKIFFSSGLQVRTSRFDTIQRSVDLSQYGFQRHFPRHGNHGAHVGQEVVRLVKFSNIGRLNVAERFGRASGVELQRMIRPINHF